MSEVAVGAIASNITQDVVFEQHPKSTRKTTWWFLNYWKCQKPAPPSLNKVISKEQGQAGAYD